MKLHLVGKIQIDYAIDLGCILTKYLMLQHHDPKSLIWFGVQMRFDQFGYEEYLQREWEKHPNYCNSLSKPYELLKSISYNDVTLNKRQESRELHIYSTPFDWWLESELLSPQNKSYVSYVCDDVEWRFMDTVARYRGYFRSWGRASPKVPGRRPLRFATADDHMTDGVEEPPMLRLWTTF